MRRQLRIQRDATGMQALEGEIDTIHAAFLHGGATQAEALRGRRFHYYQVKTGAALSVVRTPTTARLRRLPPAEEDTYYWRIADFMFPFYTHDPPARWPSSASPRRGSRCDDNNDHDFGDGRSDRWRYDAGAQKRVLQARPGHPDTTDWYGRSRP